MPYDLDQFVRTAHALADVAGTVIRPFFRSRLTASDKSDESPVTIADRMAERVMRAQLAELHPDHAILGEEFGLQEGTSGYQWTLDPIDGTRAFITGRPTFGTLISLSFEGKPIIGIIDQPITGERWIGAEGRSTLFRSGFGEPSAFAPITTRPCGSLGEADLSCTSPEMLEDAPRPVWSKLKTATKRVSWGGDCYAYGLLAGGHIDVIAECDMKPWDWSALVPVVEGAGGVMTDWNGQTLRHDGDCTVLAAGNRALHEAAVGCLRS